MLDLEKAINLVNIAESLPEDKLHHIGKQCCRGFEDDEMSRTDWLEDSVKWLKMALQISEHRSFPWPNAANVKYPLLSMAALQFHARAYPSLINTSGLLVKGEVIGDDPDGTKTDQATRVAKHMTYQILYEMKNWEEQMDKLLLQVPIIGCAFKKTYWSPYCQTNVSEMISAKDLVVDYYAKSLEDARRITHVIYHFDNDVVSRQRSGIYRDIKLPAPDASHIRRYDIRVTDELGTDASTQDDVPRLILEQHCWYDLDEDGYEEPYIVTVDFQSQQVLRIVARFQTKNIEYAGQGKKRKISRIEPDHYFTKYAFIPNPDGGFYDVGFGLLLGTLNEAANTTLNQLIDAGTLSNLQGGFLSRGIRVKAGNLSFRPGEWKVVNATGDDLKKGIFPMPVRDPSNVLFELLQLLISAGKELSTVSDIMVGKMPGQNTPATTTQMSVEQGQKVFTAIYKRLYRALQEEFSKLFELNKVHLKGDEEWQMLGDQKPPYIQVDDYKSSDFRICPAADPNVASDQAKMERAQNLMQLIPTGQINPQLAVKSVLEAQNQPNIDKIMQVPPPQPPVDIQKLQMELQAKDKWETMKNHVAMLQAKVAQFNAMTTGFLNMAKAESEMGANQMQQMQTQMQMLDQLFNQTSAVLGEADQQQQWQLEREQQAYQQQQAQQQQAAQMQQQQQAAQQQDRQAVLAHLTPLAIAAMKDRTQQMAIAAKENRQHGSEQV